MNNKQVLYELRDYVDDTREDIDYYLEMFSRYHDEYHNGAVAGAQEVHQFLRKLLKTFRTYYYRSGKICSKEYFVKSITKLCDKRVNVSTDTFGRGKGNVIQEAINFLEFIFISYDWKRDSIAFENNLKKCSPTLDLPFHMWYNSDATRG